MNRKTEKQNIGNLGEDIATRFLVKHGFRILGRNYLMKVGELDVICEKGGVIHFVEVKTVSRETRHTDVSRETDEYRPEDNVHEHKLRRIRKTIEMYLVENDIEQDWEFDVIAIVLDKTKKTANVRWLKDMTI